MEHHNESSEHESIQSSESEGQGSVRADVPPASCHLARIVPGDQVRRIADVGVLTSTEEANVLIYYLPPGESDPSKELCKHVTLNDLARRADKDIFVAYIRDCCSKKLK